MPEHEQKRCARCARPFICTPGAIHECHCSHVQLDAAQRKHIAERFSDCLCGECLTEVARAARPVTQGM